MISMRTDDMTMTDPTTTEVLPTPTSPWMSMREADDYARVRHGSIARAVNAGELRASRLPNSRIRRVHAADVDEWLRGRRFVPTFDTLATLPTAHARAVAALN